MTTDMPLKILFCPHHGGALTAMREPHRFMCLKCRVVWHIVNVIEEAYGAANRSPGEPPGDQPSRAPAEPST
jgi:hypothetical protein